MLLSNLNLVATAPDGVAKLRELILTLAVQGKLVPQDVSDEPASVLLARVAKSLPARTAKSSNAAVNGDEISAPYQLPNGWAWSRLGDIVENMGSGWSPACNEGQRSDPTKWAVLRTTAVQVNEYRAHEHKVIPLKLSPRPEIEVKDGDILITRAGPMNRVGISCWVNNTPSRLMLSDKIVRFHSIADEMLPAFIVLALNAGWTKNQIEEAKTGMAASQVNISQTDLRGFWLPVCSKAEQSRIVTRVEELMRLCDALQAKARLEATQHEQLVRTLLASLTAPTVPNATPQAQADAIQASWHRVATHFDLLLDRPEAVDALEQTILQLAVRGLLVPQDPTDEPACHLLQKIRTEKDRLIAEGKIRIDKPVAPITEGDTPFELPIGWQWVRFDELTHPLKPIAYGVLVPGPDVETGVPFVRIADLSLTNPPSKPDKSIAPEVDAQFQRTRLEGGEILMGVVGSIGKLGVAPSTWAGANIARAICRIVPADSGLNDFVMFLLQTQFMQESFAGDTRTLAQPTLNIGLIRAALTPVPPPAEQSRIVARVASLRALCADLRQRLTTARTQQALLAQVLVENVS